MQAGVKQARAAAILRDLMRCLDISREDAATMFGVTGEIAAGWESGETEVPEIVFARMISASHALGRLREIFRPDRLPQLIRRRADAFGAERALAWILDGRIAEVAEAYDSGLSYLPKSA